MLRGMVRLTTAGDVLVTAIAVVAAAGLGTIAAAEMAGVGRLCVECIVGAAALGVVIYRGLGILRRYQQLAAGRCPNPMCRGVVRKSQLARDDEVVCPTCKSRWPELTGMHFRVTARG